MGGRDAAHVAHIPVYHLQNVSYGYRWQFYSGSCLGVHGPLGFARGELLSLQPAPGK